MQMVQLEGHKVDPISRYPVRSRIILNNILVHIFPISIPQINIVVNLLGVKSQIEDLAPSVRYQISQ